SAFRNHFPTCAPPNCPEYERSQEQLLTATMTIRTLMARKSFGHLGNWQTVRPPAAARRHRDQRWRNKLIIVCRSLRATYRVEAAALWTLSVIVKENLRFVLVSKQGASGRAHITRRVA